MDGVIQALVFVAGLVGIVSIAVGFFMLFGEAMRALSWEFRAAVERTFERRK